MPSVRLSSESMGEPWPVQHFNPAALGWCPNPPTPQKSLKPRFAAAVLKVVNTIIAAAVLPLAGLGGE